MATFLNFGGGSGKQGFVIDDYIQTVNTGTEWKLVGKTNGNQYSFTTHLRVAQQTYTYFYAGILIGNLWIMIKNYWDMTVCDLNVYAMKDTFSPTAAIEYGQAQSSHTLPRLANRSFNTGTKGGACKFDIQVNVNETNITVATGGDVFATIPLTSAINANGNIYITAAKDSTVNKIYFVQR